MGPETLICLHPVVHGLQLLRVELIQAVPAVPARRDDPHPAQHAEVLRHWRLGNPEFFDQFANRVHSTASQRVDDLAPPGLGNGVKDVRGRRRSWHHIQLYSYMGICQVHRRELRANRGIPPTLALTRDVWARVRTRTRERSRWPRR